MRVKSSMKRHMALVMSGKNAVTRDALHKNSDMKNASLTSFSINLDDFQLRRFIIALSS